MTVERNPLRRAIEWLAPWYDVKAEAARIEAVDAAVDDAVASAGTAARVIRRRRDDVRGSFRRANERLGGR